jgi:hypothetical protein
MYLLDMPIALMVNCYIIRNHSLNTCGNNSFPFRFVRSGLTSPEVSDRRSSSDVMKCGPRVVRGGMTRSRASSMPEREHRRIQLSAVHNYSRAYHERL